VFRPAERDVPFVRGDAECITSLCDEGATFHDFSKEIISHSAQDEYFTYSLPNIANRPKACYSKIKKGGLKPLLSYDPAIQAEAEQQLDED